MTPQAGVGCGCECQVDAAVCWANRPPASPSTSPPFIAFSTLPLSSSEAAASLQLALCPSLLPGLLLLCFSVTWSITRETWRRMRLLVRCAPPASPGPRPRSAPPPPAGCTAARTATPRQARPAHPAPHLSPPRPPASPCHPCSAAQPVHPLVQVQLDDELLHASHTFSLLPTKAAELCVYRAVCCVYQSYLGGHVPNGHTVSDGSSNPSAQPPLPLH